MVKEAMTDRFFNNPFAQSGSGKGTAGNASGAGTNREGGARGAGGGSKGQGNTGQGGGADATESRMLSRLRKRFVLITMGLVGAVLAITLAIWVVSNYQIQSAEIHAALNAAVGTDENSDLRPLIGGMPRGPRTDSAIIHFTTQPVYVVMYDDAGQWHDTVNNSALMNATVLTEAIERVRQSVASQGLLLDMGLFYACNHDFGDSGMTRIAFANAGPLLSSTVLGTVVALVIWMVAMGLILLISLYLSRLALRPVAEAWQKQRRFIADASHELKTPLTAILANVNIMTSSPEATVAEQSQWLKSTQVEAQRMNSLIRDLLILAQADEEQPARERRLKDGRESLPSCNLSDVVDRALLQFDAVFFERSITVAPAITSALFTAGSVEQLDRLVAILLDNASKYSPRGGTVRVTLSQGWGAAGGGMTGAAGGGVAPTTASGGGVAPATTSGGAAAPATTGGGGAVGSGVAPATISGGRVAGAGEGRGSDAAFFSASAIPATQATLTVANGGEPIPPETLAHIFERFYRGDKAHSDTVEGYGLGLSIAESIVVSLDGSIQAVSDAERGTIFTVTLPLANEG
jgi:signal transduction histidine kinase